MSSSRPTSGVSRGSSRKTPSADHNNPDERVSGSSHGRKHINTPDSIPDHKVKDMPPSKTVSKKAAKGPRYGNTTGTGRGKGKGEKGAVKTKPPSPVPTPLPAQDDKDTEAERTDPVPTEPTDSRQEQSEDLQTTAAQEEVNRVEYDPNWKPKVIAPEDFDAREFLDSISALQAKLQTDTFKHLDEDVDADVLQEMVESVTTVMKNLTSFSDHSQKKLEQVREQMREIKERAYKKIQSRPYDKSGDTRVGLEEREVEAKHQRLNKELARIGEELVRSAQLSLETEAAATEASLEAERAAAEARQIQEEYEQRKLAEQEVRRVEAERKEAEEVRRQEMERKQEEVRREEEARRNRLRKQPAHNEAENQTAEWENWPVFNYNMARGGGICHIRGNPHSFKENMVECSVVSQLDVEFEYGANEELVSSIIRISSPHGEQQLPSPIQVVVPHHMSRVSAMTREPVIKARYEGSDWAHLRTFETSHEGQKDVKYVQAEVTNYGDLAVVTRFKQDYLTFHKRGGKVASGVDSRIVFSADRGVFQKPEHFTLQLQPVDSNTVNELRLQSPDSKSLLTASSIVSMEWASNTFEGPVTMTLPCPPNPVMAKKAAAARAAKEAKMKSPAAPPMPVVDDASVAARRDKKRSTKGSTQTGVEEEETTSKKAAPTKWYMGQYGTNDDDESDLLFFVHKATNGRWVVRESPCAEQVKLDLVQFTMLQPIPRFIILRTRTGVENEEAQKIAESIEKRLSTRMVQSIIKQRSDDLCDVCLELTLQSKTEKVINQLAEEGYEEGPGTSKEMALNEGDRIEVQFRGNIKRFNEQGDSNATPLNLIFDSQSENRLQFSILEVDKFLQKSYDVYRGFVQLYRVTKDVHKARRHDDGVEEEAVVEYKRQLITEHLISIPKEPELPRMVAKVPVTLRAGSDAINEETLRVIASHLGDEWPKVAHYLNVKRIRIQAIMRNTTVNDSSEEDAKYDMLVTWVKKVPRSVNKVESLRSALIRSCREDLADELDRMNKEYREGKRDVVETEAVQ